MESIDEEDVRPAIARSFCEDKIQAKHGESAEVIVTSTVLILPEEVLRWMAILSIGHNLLFSVIKSRLPSVIYSLL